MSDSIKKGDKSKKPLSTGEELYNNGLIDHNKISEVNSIRSRYSIKAPFGYTRKIKSNDATDPLWQTVIPTQLEKHSSKNELKDPIGDTRRSPLKGIVHRHVDRILFMPTNICAMYCRFCFRKNVVGKSNYNLKPSELELALTYIKNHNEIWEVILTGGDPFVLSNKKLQYIINALIEIEHIKIIRFHTRIFIANPYRIDSGIVKIFKKALKHKAVYIVTHINHMQEIDEDVETSCLKLINIGVCFLNQSVLLKNINDTAEKLTALFKKLVELRIKPYYLHHLDLTIGTDHFRKNIADGQKLIKQIRLNLSGLCVPTYVLDIPGGYNKVPIEALYLHQNNLGKYFIEDSEGIIHEYPST